jgi:quinol monooxygenase YgiN
MSKVALFATITAAPGKRDELLEKFKMMLDAVEREDGCEVYLAHTSDDEPDKIFMYELYSSVEAFDSHMSGEAMAAFVTEAGALFGGPLDLKRLSLHGGKGTRG